MFLFYAAQPAFASVKGFFKIFLAGAAEGAGEIFGQILKCRTGLNTVLGVPGLFIILPTAKGAYVLHTVSFAPFHDFIIQYSENFPYVKRKM